MRGNVNKLMIVGNLGQDPELRHTAKGTAVMSFSIATGSKYKRPEDGVEIDTTEWHRAVVWGKRAESCALHLKKGNRVYLEGPLKTRTWKDKDGTERKTTEIQVRDVQFLGHGKNIQP